MTLTAELLTAGTELLKGSVLNTNARFLGRELTDLGFVVKGQQACRDEIPAIRERLAEALSRSDLVIVSGGLGPTPDDVTRDAVAEFFRAPLVFSRPQFLRIQKYYRRRGRKVPGMVRREAMFPQNAVPLVNHYGIALGFTISQDGRLVVVLPGVPEELEKMFRRLVRPLLRRFFRRLKSRPAFTARIAGLSEPEVMRRLGKDFFKAPFDFGIYPEAGEVTLRLQADTKTVLAELRKKICVRLGDSLYSLEDISLAEAVGRILAQKGKTLAVAESCTGGLLASEITKVPGASRYFKGSVTAYDDLIKEEWLEVPRSLLVRKGAVSRESALMLARVVRKKMKSSYGLAVTGIAGPSGGSPSKPVGLVFIALASADKSRAWRHHFWGDRIQIQTKAMKKALEHLWRRLTR